MSNSLSHLQNIDPKWDICDVLFLSTLISSLFLEILSVSDQLAHTLDESCSPSYSYFTRLRAFLETPGLKTMVESALSRLTYAYGTLTNLERIISHSLMEGPIKTGAKSHMN